MPKPDLLTMAEAAKVAGLSYSAMRRRVQNGDITPIQEDGGPQKSQKLFRAADVEALVQDILPTANAAEVEKQIIGRVLDRMGAGILDEKYEPQVRWSVRQDKLGAPGTPVLVISDVHYGEIVDPEQVMGSNEFNPEICALRMEHTFETAVLLLKRLESPDYPGIVVMLAGDMITGFIHEELMATSASPPLVQMVEVARLVSDGLAFLSKEFPKVDVYCVPGNHGRTTKRTWAKWQAQTNLDWLSYVFVRDHCQGLKNVTIHCPPVRSLNIEVAGRRYFLTHGDQYRGGDGIIGPLGPVTRGDNKKRAQMMTMPFNPGYDTQIIGHFHRLYQDSRLIINGTMKGADEWGFNEKDFPYEPPQQALFTVHPRFGHTYYMPILCDGE